MVFNFKKKQQTALKNYFETKMDLLGINLTKMVLIDNHWIKSYLVLMVSREKRKYFIKKKETSTNNGEKSVE